jgi:hypothetical protein
LLPKSVISLMSGWRAKDLVERSGVCRHCLLSEAEENLSATQFQFTLELAAAAKADPYEFSLKLRTADSRDDSAFRRAKSIAALSAVAKDYGWDKQRTVFTRTLYWFRRETRRFVRQKNAPWCGKAGENSTFWYIR